MKPTPMPRTYGLLAEFDKPEALVEKIKVGLNNRQQLREMGQTAAESVTSYDLKYFIENWGECYRTFSKVS